MSSLPSVYEIACVPVIKQKQELVKKVTTLLDFDIRADGSYYVNTHNPIGGKNRNESYWVAVAAGLALTKRAQRGNTIRKVLVIYKGIL